MVEWLLIFGLVGTGIINYPVVRNPTVEQTEDWDKSSLSKESLLQVIKNKDCHASDKTYLACASAVDDVGRNIGIIITPSGNFTKEWKKESSQKKRMETWVKNKNPKIDFEAIVHRLFKITEPRTHKYLAAEGINAFLSVEKDPHTYIEPIPDDEGLNPSDELVFEDPTDLNESDLLDLPDTGAHEEEEEDDSVTMLVNKNLEMPSLLTIDNFKENTCKKVNRALKKAKKENVRNLVLDLKDNPGGIVDEVSCVCGLFLGPKPVVTLWFFNDKQKDYKKEEVPARSKKVYDGNLTVLVNEKSASASEILAGTLQHYKRATIVGEQTYGKGSFQQVVGSDFDKYKVRFRKTMGLYFLPDHKTPQIKGLTPDRFEGKKQSTYGEKEFLYPISADVFDK